MTNESGQHKWLTVEEISTPRGYIVEVIRDSWWSQRQDGKVALYRGVFPQCNSDRRISEAVGSRSFPGYVGVVFIPLAFIPHKCERY